MSIRSSGSKPLPCMQETKAAALAGDSHSRWLEQQILQTRGDLADDRRLPPSLLYAQGPGNSRSDDGPGCDAVVAQHRHGGLGRNGTELSVSDKVVGELQRVDLDANPNFSTLPPEQFLNVMTKMTPGAWKNEFLAAQVSNLETGVRREGVFFAQEKKRLSCQWLLINPIDNPLGVMNKDSEIYKSLSKLLM
jgi:hypothetical protein